MLRIFKIHAFEKPKGCIEELKNFRHSFEKLCIYGWLSTVVAFLYTFQNNLLSSTKN